MSSDTALAAEPPTQGKGSPFTYDAFLSDSHQDQAVAAGIQKGLHHIGRRVGQLNALHVFRESTDLSANPNLWESPTRWTAPAISSWCSPNTRRNPNGSTTRSRTGWSSVGQINC